MSTGVNAGLGHDQEIGCDYCTLAAGSPQDWLVATPSWLAIASPLRLEPGWVVVLSRRHVDRLGELTTGELEELGPLIARVSVAAEAVGGAENVYVFKVGERTRHVHFLVVPRTASTPANMRGPSIVAEADALRDPATARLETQRLREYFAASADS